MYACSELPIIYREAEVMIEYEKTKNKYKLINLKNGNLISEDLLKLYSG